MQKYNTPEVNSNNEPAIEAKGSERWKYNAKQKSRCWEITINNYTDEEEDIFRREMSKYQFYKYQIEEGLEFGTEHIQGCVWHEPKIEARRIKNLFPRASFTPAKCEEALIKYCGKLMTRIRGPYTNGIEPIQGKRNDLESACETFKESGIDGVIKNHLEIYIKYSKGFENLTLKHIHNTPRTIAPHCTYVNGATFLQRNFDDVMNLILKKNVGLSIHIQDQDNPLWDGYEQQDVLVYLQNKEIKNISFMISRFPYPVKISYGTRQLNSPLIYFIDTQVIQC